MKTPHEILNPQTYALLPDDNSGSKLGQLIENGIELDEYGLIVPKATDLAIRQKITADLLDARSRIAEVLGEGKHVIYLPGSYDLVHAGHASYVFQCIDSYLQNHTRINRRDLFVAILADDDELIRAVKPSYLRDQPTDHPRPIQNHELFEHLTDVHPRLLDLASLPVDMVGFIPAPTCAGKLLNSWLFKRWMETKGSFDNYPAGIAKLGNGESDDLSRQTIHDYERMLSLIKDGNFVDVLQSFQSAKHLLHTDADQESWSVGAWQLLIHKFLGSVPGSSGAYVRIISENDTKYKEQVSKLMQVSRIDFEYVQDSLVLSTTGLVGRFGWRTLYESKAKVYQMNRQK